MQIILLAYHKSHMMKTYLQNLHAVWEWLQFWGETTRCSNM